MESVHERRVRRFVALRLFGPRTDQWKKFYDETAVAGVQRKPDVSLTEAELAAELQVFKGEMEKVGTWPVILIILITPLLAVGGLFWGGWGVATGVFVAGAFLGSGVLAAIRNRNQRLWTDFERQIEQA